MVTASTGIISTVVGTGSGSYSGDNGPATDAATNPAGVAADASGKRLLYNEVTPLTWLHN